MSWTHNLILDQAVYPLHVVQRVAYALAASMTLLIRQEGNRIELEAVPALIAGTDRQVPDAAHAHELLLRHLNDFALREQIQRETSGLREILAAAALKGAGV